MKQPQVSVIMPAYNVEPYIEEAISSVLHQSFDDFELIIVNDGSTDNTGKIIREFVEKDERIIFIDKENEGVSVARNTAMEKAQGEYLALLDSDDYWHEDFLNVMIKEAEKNPDAGLFYVKPEMFFAGGKRYVQEATLVMGKLKDNLSSSNELRFPFGMSSSSFIRHEVIEKYKIYFPAGLPIGEDVAFFAKLLCVTKAQYVDGVLSFYRQREDSAMKTDWSTEKNAGAVTAIITLADFCKEDVPEMLPVAEKIISYKVYRFILGLLKKGQREEAERYIKEWREWLEKFTKNGGRLRDRLKCRVILWGLIR